MSSHPGDCWFFGDRLHCVRTRFTNNSRPVAILLLIQEAFYEQFDIGAREGVTSALSLTADIQLQRNMCRDGPSA